MDELDEAVDVLDGDGLVLLLVVVNVAVEDFNEELHGYGGVHAGICDAESALQAFEDALSVTIYLWSERC